MIRHYRASIGRTVSALLCFIGVACPAAEPPPGYVLIAAGADKSDAIYVNPKTIEESIAYEFDSPTSSTVSLLLFESAEVTKGKGKAPSSWQLYKQGIKCDKQVMFAIRPSSDGDRLVYSNAKIVVSGTMGKAVADYVCSALRSIDAPAKDAGK